MRGLIVCFVAVAAATSTAYGAPRPSVEEPDQRSLVGPVAPHTPIAPVLPVTSGSGSHHQSAFDQGAHQASASSGQGSLAYDHGGQASKVFGNKESSGSKENYAYSANNAYNQGSGSFSHLGAFNNAAQLTAGLEKHFQQAGLTGIASSVPGVPGIAPVFPGVLGASVPFIPAAGVVSSGVAGNHQQGSLASGHAQGQGSWSYNQGQSSVNASGNKETFSNKESFGQESSASHAAGAAQNAHAQNSQAGHHNKGHQVTSVNQGTTVLG